MAGGEAGITPLPTLPRKGGGLFFPLPSREGAGGGGARASGQNIV